MFEQKIVSPRQPPIYLISYYVLKIKNFRHILLGPFTCGPTHLERDSARNNSFPNHSNSYHSIVYHSSAYNPTSSHSIEYHSAWYSAWYHSTVYHSNSCNLTLYHSTWYHSTWYHSTVYHSNSCNLTLYHSTWYHSTWYHSTWYHSTVYHSNSCEFNRISFIASFSCQSILERIDTNSISQLYSKLWIFFGATCFFHLIIVSYQLSFQQVNKMRHRQS